MTGGVFISYRREDAAGFAGRLADSLERNLPHEPVFRDVDALAPGQDFVAAIDARLRQCRACLAVIGRDWLNARDAQGRRRLDQPDDFVRLELTAALARPEGLVIPVLVEGASMPPAEALPLEIRALARRQAVSLRDDTWDADVARLVASLQPAHAPGAGLLRTAGAVPVSWKVGAGALAVVALALLANTLRPDGDPASGGSREPATAPAAAEIPRTDPAGPVSSNGSPARAVAIPLISQVGSKTLIYTLMSASLEPGGESDTLRVRVGLENSGQTAVNFWDDSFRLVINGDPIAPTSRLNTLVDGQATGDGDVTFVVPKETMRGMLRISVLQTSGDIPLDFSARPSGSGPPSSRSARAVVTTISEQTQPLVSTPALAATATGVSTRRFANVLRVDVAVRLAATGQGSLTTGDLTLRLVVGDDVLAPTAYPIHVVQAGATQRVNVQFEVPPSTTHAVLRATAGDQRADVPLLLR